MATEQSDRLLTVAEVAEHLRLHPITIRRHIKSGLLPAVRIGRAVRVRASDVEAFAKAEPPPTGGVYRQDSGRAGRLRIGERSPGAVGSVKRTGAVAEPGPGWSSASRAADEILREARRELLQDAERWKRRPLRSLEELARLKGQSDEARKRRDALPSLGMSTAELVRLARSARDWMYDVED